MAILKKVLAPLGAIDPKVWMYLILAGIIYYAVTSTGTNIATWMGFNTKENLQKKVAKQDILLDHLISSSEESLRNKLNKDKSVDSTIEIVIDLAKDTADIEIKTAKIETNRTVAIDKVLSDGPIERTVVITKKKIKKQRLTSVKTLPPPIIMEAKAAPVELAIIKKEPLPIIEVTDVDDYTSEENNIQDIEESVEVIVLEKSKVDNVSEINITSIWSTFCSTGGECVT